MLLLLSISGILLSAILLYCFARKFTSSIYLGTFFLLIGLYALIQYVLLHSKSAFPAGIIFINTGFLACLAGPMLYWYIRSTLTDNYQLRKRDLWHLLPIFLLLTGNLPYLLIPWSNKVQPATQILEATNYQDLFRAIPTFDLFPKSAVFLSCPILVMAYTLWSIGLFLNYFIRKRQTAVLSHQHFMIKFLIVLLSCTVVLVFSHLLMMIQVVNFKDADEFYILNILKAISGAGLLGLLILPFIYPAILIGLPHLPDSLFFMKKGKENAESILTVEQNGTLKYESLYLKLIDEKVDDCMQGYRPYVRQGFNLVQFSVMINTPVHHLAYFFREYKKLSFSDFRDNWRIRRAKALIINGKNSGMTLEMIGLLSGFSTFRKFTHSFEKVEGITPDAFAAQTKS
jgi:AraC-like DNA-binding protein